MTRVMKGLAAALCGAAMLSAQEKPAHDMGKVRMVFLRVSPTWKGDAARVTREHRAHVERLVKAGQVALAGEVAGDGELREVLVFKTEAAASANATTQALPAVKAGMLRADALTWFTARNLLTTPTTPLERTDYVFGVLVRGAKWTAEVTEETKKLQEGHMANIGRLADAGKLVLAGPFEDGGERRGVFIFKVGTLEEAQALTDTDPAVAAGRLKIELHRLSVPKGTLP